MLLTGLVLRVLYGLGPVFILLSHLGSLLLFRTGIGAGALLWVAALYLVRMLATTAIYHRLVTHGSYRASRPVWWIGCLVAASAGQMGPSWWKAHHLAHHRHVDTPQDPHSPISPKAGWPGFWHAQAGWLLAPGFYPSELPADVEADPVLRAIDRFHFLPLIGLGWLSWGLGGLPWLAAFCLSTTLLFHGVATVNSLAHLHGTRPFRTSDASFNNGFVALITLGEGWHNLHHAFQTSARQGFGIRRGRVVLLPDPTFWFIRLLERIGLADRLRLPTQHALLARAADPSRSASSSSADRLVA